MEHIPNDPSSTPPCFIFSDVPCHNPRDQFRARRKRLGMERANNLPDSFAIATNTHSPHRIDLPYDSGFSWMPFDDSASATQEQQLVELAISSQEGIKHPLADEVSATHQRTRIR